MQKSLSKLAATCLFLTLAANALVAQEQKRPANPMDQFPKVVALVNGQQITRDKLAQDCLKRYGTTVLDNLLNKHLILQACNAKGIKITQQDVNAEIERVSNKVGLSQKLFLEALEKERDITPEQYASEIVWPMLALRALAADQIEVKPEEIEQIIQSEYGPKVQVRMIAVTQAEKAQQIHQQAMAAPETFRRLAKEHSEDPTSASMEGLLPPIRHVSEDDKLEKIAFQLQPNQISPVFQIGEVHYILQCQRHYPESMPNAQLMPMIRERIAEQLRDQRLGEAANGIFEALQTQSQVVKVLGDREKEKQYPGVAGYINNQPVALVHVAAECLARHGREILRGEISRLLLTSSLEKAGKTITQLDIDAEIARAADVAGYITREGRPDVEGWIKSIQEEEGATIELYVSDAVWPSVALKKLVEDEVQLTDEDLQKGYESNYGPRAEVLAIVLSSQRTAMDVFGQFQMVQKTQPRSVWEQSFGELAAKYSVEPVSRSNFGKIPPIRKFSGRPTLEDAAFGLLPDEMSGVLAWGDQFAILYKQGETKPIVKDFEAVREELEKEILEKKMRLAMHQKMDALLKSSQIDNFLEGSAQTGEVIQAAAQNASAQPRR